ATDNQIAFQETVKAIALQKGMIASFLPKIFPQESGSGCHLHLSLWKNDRNISGASDDTYGLSPEGKQFIAGILHHLPGLMGISTPTTNSYHRIKPHTGSGAFGCWGIDNREAAVRVISEKDNCVKHFEIKPVDASSNPYLALGAIISAGYDGIKNEMTLPEAVQQDPGTLTPDERSTKKIKPLPTHLDQALSYLEKDRDLMDAVGSKLSQGYLAVKKAEFEYFKDLSQQEEVEILLDKF
ncbi:MAG: glutamine synthetase, partial [Methanobacterium sp.]|nr:glutamine synthetase [Euryarchaeota archaeon]MBV1729866.1 glutamine synthetase [Methanobacterium sp.]